MVEFKIIKFAQYLSTRTGLGLCLILLLAAETQARAQIIEIFPDGSTATYAGPVMSGPDGIRALAPPSAARAPAPGKASVTSAIRNAATRHQLSERLVEAVAWQESRLQQNAVSPKGARGIMQLMPATAQRYSVRDAYEPYANIEAGIKYLKSLLDRFELPLALAAYNAGEAAVQRFGGLPPYPETRQYVSRVRQLVGR